MEQGFLLILTTLYKKETKRQFQNAKIVIKV